MTFGHTISPHNDIFPYRAKHQYKHHTNASLYTACTCRNTHNVRKERLPCTFINREYCCIFARPCAFECADVCLCVGVSVIIIECSSMFVETIYSTIRLGPLTLQAILEDLSDLTTSPNTLPTAPVILQNFITTAVV